MLMNYVELLEGIPKKLHFTDHYYVKREIWDEEFQRMKPIESLVFWVDNEDGEPTAKTFSILSSKLAARFTPYIPGNAYRMKLFTITSLGKGFQRRFEVDAENFNFIPAET